MRRQREADRRGETAVFRRQERKRTAHQKMGPASHPVCQLQRQVGNRHTQRMLTALHASSLSTQTRPVIQRWSGGVHKQLTRDWFDGYFPGMPEIVKRGLINSSDDMDLRISELIFNIRGASRGSQFRNYPHLRHAMLVQLYQNNLAHALNHGEGGCYAMSKEKAAPRNVKQQQKYIDQARRLMYSRQQGALWAAVYRLGDALHVAQDRGSHGEGAIGLGHDNPDWNPDDPKENPAGFREAEANTDAVLKEADDVLHWLYRRATRRRKRR